MISSTVRSRTLLILDRRTSSTQQWQLPEVFSSSSAKVSLKKCSHDVAETRLKQTQEESYRWRLLIGPSPCYITSRPHVTSQHARANRRTRSAGACKLNLLAATPVQSDRAAWQSFCRFFVKPRSLHLPPFTYGLDHFHSGRYVICVWLLPWTVP